MHGSRMLAIAAVLGTVALGLVACGGSESGGGDAEGGSKTFAFVTNGKYAFWELAEPGVVKAGRDLGVEVLFRMPENTMSGQKQTLEDLLNRDVDGIAVSVLHPENQNPLLNRIADRVPLVTHDSDAPNSKRSCFVGVDNYEAGRLVGELALETLPEGGKLALFIGNLSQDNARLRRQGFLDVVLGRAEPTPLDRVDPTGAALEGTLADGRTFAVVGTYTDDGDTLKAKANCEDALNRYPDLVGVAGFFQYNPPACLTALRSKGSLGKVAVFGFDENEDTLNAIEAGHCAGTVVQNPYEYGYQSIRILEGLSRGDDSVLPEGGVLRIPARTIRKDDLAGFRAEVAAQRSVLEGR